MNIVVRHILALHFKISVWSPGDSINYKIRVGYRALTLSYSHYGFMDIQLAMDIR